MFTLLLMDDRLAVLLLLSVSECTEKVICAFLQAGGEERHPDCVSVGDPGQKSRSEAAAQSSGHRAVWTAPRSECDVTGNVARSLSVSVLPVCE